MLDPDARNDDHASNSTGRSSGRRTKYPPLPLAGPPHQIRRIQMFLDDKFPASALPDECPGDTAIRLLSGDRDVARLAAALARAMGMDGHPNRLDGSTRPPGRVQPYQRKRQLISAVQVEPGLCNLGRILMLLPETRYKIAATRAEITFTDLLTGEVHLAWKTDWLVRSPDGNWAVMENNDFYDLYEPLMPVDSDG